MDYEAVPKNKSYRTQFRWSTIIMIWIAVMMIYAMLNNPYDDTDLVHEDMQVRSGFKLYIDYGTGCQYLSVGNLGTALGLVSASLHPRLDAEGQPMCMQLDARIEE